jgi:hypothetical protein
MLKRNGEDCGHQVPNFPGLLTASELKAYNAAVPLVAEQVRLIHERTAMLSEIDMHSAEIAEQVASQTAHDLPTVTTRGGEVPDKMWHVNHVLFKLPRSEILLGSREVEGIRYFGIIEKFPPDSPYTRARGETDLLTFGRNAFSLLLNYVENERGVLRLYRQDMEATVAESLAEKFPNQDHSRIVKAISARCETPAQSESQQAAKVEQQTRNVKIRS